MLSVALERRLSKEDIFALYCNEVYLGQRGAVAVRGVSEAARVYAAVLAVAPPMEQLAPDLRAAVLRAREVCARNQRELDAFLDEQNYCLVYWRAARQIGSNDVPRASSGVCRD